ncbi:MAG: hypothetical protein WBW93_01695 [Steroidobacteraceae bacterium]
MLKKAHRTVNSPDNERVYGMRALRPALALVDPYGDPDAWHPAVDDLDTPAE